MENVYAEVINALKRKEAYDEKASYVKVIQTHISYVFLTGKFAYKIKKPVDFGFLDYTTLEKRKFFCEEEIRLNKPLAGELYIGAVPINMDEHGKIKIRGEGKPVEYAVKMLELPQEAMMSRLLKKNRVKNEHILSIAEMLARFHEKAKSDEDIAKFGSIRHISFVWKQNFEQTLALKEKIISKDDFDFVESRVFDFIEKNKELFERRIRKKRIRECHGDVHSGNIFIIKSTAPNQCQKDKIYIFDAIEFNLAFRSCDVASEIAFFMMDLEYNKRNDFSEVFYRRYLELTKDYEIEKLIDFYKCYRAYVRAKVTGFRLFDANISDAERKECERITKNYFNLALSYAELF